MTGSGRSVRSTIARWLAGGLAVEAALLVAVDAVDGGRLLWWIVVAATLAAAVVYLGLARAVAQPLSGLLADEQRARSGHAAAEPFQVSGGGLEEADRIAALFNDMGRDYFESRRQLQETANHANTALVSTVEQLQARTAELNQRTVELERALYTINQLATTDSLTGLYNRRYFDQRLDEILARARRHDEPVALVLIDIDKFKEINDSLGHAAGDAVLKDIGSIIRSRTRASDVSARLGGDEFAFVLPRAGLDESRVLADGLLSKASEHEFRYGAIRIQVTLSVGVGHFVHAPSRSDVIFKTADDALYQAKRGGRNRVAFVSAGAAPAGIGCLNASGDIHYGN